MSGVDIVFQKDSRNLFGGQRNLFGAQRKLFGAQRINKERSPKLSKSSEHRERLSDFFKRGFEKESALLIPTTPLKAMDENYDTTITDQTLCIEGGKLMTTSQSFRLTVRNISRFPVCKRNFRDREPSRVPVKKFLQILNKRKLGLNAERVIKHSTPTSSNLHWLATDFKLWYVSFLQRREAPKI